MRVYVAEGSGFCFGVKRAMDMAYKYAAENKAVYSLHEIIHNPQEVKRLEKAGARHVEAMSDIPKGSPAIISTHGISEAEEKELKERCPRVLDTTCPYVKKIHNIVKKMAKEKYRIVIVGDRDHLEVKGILGCADGQGIVVSSLKDVKKAELKEKVCVVAQTTLDMKFYRDAVLAIGEKAFSVRNAEVRIYNTICDATKSRQAATMSLAKNMDVMIIVGGRNSANTKRLYELCRAILRDVHLVEAADEIKKSWFKGKKSAGVSAGASTPESAIKEVVNTIKTIGEK